MTPGTSRRSSATLGAAAGVDMVSEMVRLNCASLAERALVPAFVYFFQMLYPFARVNDPRSSGGGGRRRHGAHPARGPGAHRRHRRHQGRAHRRCRAGEGGQGARAGAIFLGHSGLAASIRPYPRFRGHLAHDRAHARSLSCATPQRCSCSRVLGLSLVWLVPGRGSPLFGHGWARACGLAACALAAIELPADPGALSAQPAWALALPLIALFYMAATVGSAVDALARSGRALEEPLLRERFDPLTPSKARSSRAAGIDRRIGRAEHRSPARLAIQARRAERFLRDARARPAEPRRGAEQQLPPASA